MAAAVCALSALGLAVPSAASAASAEPPPSGEFCIFSGTGYTGSHFCQTGGFNQIFFTVRSYFSDSGVPWCIVDTRNHITGVSHGGGSSSAYIVATVMAPCALLA